ncbi:GumC family protein [Janthinobacterium sp. RB2R34]|uniref:GumC family protein n=1 Tax=Janthinobacterium sp. RB2R34 TaxID=3424193 RepID=UPI003F237EE8
MVDMIKDNNMNENGIINNEKIDDDIHLIDFLIVLARRKKIIFGSAIFFGAAALLAGVLMTPIFTGRAVILPPQQQQSFGVAAMLGQIGGLSSGAGALAGLKNPNDIYVGMLESRTISYALINKFKLLDRYEVDTYSSAEKKLREKTNIVNAKTGLISIQVEDSDPKIAADMANTYVEELAKLTRGLAITEASRRRLFFEGKLSSAKDELAKAEMAMKKMQQNTGVIQLDGQVKEIIASMAQLQANIASREVQLAAMRSFATSNNPEYQKLQNEISALNGQLGNLKREKFKKDGGIMTSSGEIPEVGIEYIRVLRDVKYNESIFELVAKQFELAKIDEAKDSTSIQELDRAIPAERKSKPMRFVLLISGTLGGGIFGILIALFREMYVRSRKNKAMAKRWDELSIALRMR